MTLVTYSVLYQYLTSIQVFGSQSQYNFPVDSDFSLSWYWNHKLIVQYNLKFMVLLNLPEN